MYSDWNLGFSKGIVGGLFGDCSARNYPEAVWGKDYFRANYKPQYTTVAEEPTKEYVFTDPTPLRCKDWDVESVCEDALFRLLHAPEAHKGKSLDALVKDQTVPLLCITGKLYAEIRYIVMKNPTLECAMFLTLKRLNENRPHWLAFDLFMPGQKVSSGGVSLDGPDCEKYFEAVKSGTPYYQEHGLHRHICHLHSHASFGTFWSSTDDKQQLSREDLGFMDDYRLYVVVNAAESVKASLVIYKPALVRMDAAVALAYGGEGYAEQLTRQRKAELDVLIDNALQKSSVLKSEHAEAVTLGGTSVAAAPTTTKPATPVVATAEQAEAAPTETATDKELTATDAFLRLLEPQDTQAATTIYGERSFAEQFVRMARESGKYDILLPKDHGDAYDILSMLYANVCDSAEAAVSEDADKSVRALLYEDCAVSLAELVFDAVLCFAECGHALSSAEQERSSVDWVDKYPRISRLLEENIIGVAEASIEDRAEAALAMQTELAVEAAELLLACSDNETKF